MGSADEQFPIRLQRCLNRSNLRPEFPVCPLAHATQPAPWLICQDWSAASQQAVLLQVCRKKHIFISYSCNGLIAASEEGEGQSHGVISSKALRISPSQGITVAFAEPDSFLPWQLMCLDICLDCGSVSSPCWQKLGQMLKATAQLHSDAEQLLSFLHQHKRCNNKKQNHHITVALLIHCLADWLCSLRE